MAVKRSCAAEQLILKKLTLMLLIKQLIPDASCFPLSPMAEFQLIEAPEFKTSRYSLDSTASPQQQQQQQQQQQRINSALDYHYVDNPKRYVVLGESQRGAYKAPAISDNLYESENEIGEVKDKNEGSLIGDSDSAEAVAAAVEISNESSDGDIELERPTNRPIMRIASYSTSDFDLDGKLLRQPLELWRTMKINQLLETLSSSIPPPANPVPLYRSGRTYPSSATLSGGPQTMSAVAQDKSSRIRIPLIGIEWPSSFSSRIKQVSPADNRFSLRNLNNPTTMAKTSHSSSATNNLPKVASHRQKQLNQFTGTGRGGEGEGEGEAAMQTTPIHSRTVSDYGWKRVENSRWNNLRGMWGKRAVSELT